MVVLIEIGKVEIEWHVSTELGAKGIQKLFDNAKPTINIKVKYIKQQWEILIWLLFYHIVQKQ